MLNPQEASIELKKYLKKLSRIIEQEATFTFIKSKIVDKNKIDDILCCIDATFPDEYRAFIKKSGARGLKSYALYLQILGAIKNKFMFSTSVYKVRHGDALSLISSMINSLDSDINFVYSDQSGMF